MQLILAKETKYFLWGKNHFLGLKMPPYIHRGREQTTVGSTVNYGGMAVLSA